MCPLDCRVVAQEPHHTHEPEFSVGGRAVRLSELTPDDVESLSPEDFQVCAVRAAVAAFRLALFVMFWCFLFSFFLSFAPFFFLFIFLLFFLSSFLNL